MEYAKLREGVSSEPEAASVACSPDERAPVGTWYAARWTDRFFTVLVTLGPAIRLSTTMSRELMMSCETPGGVR